MTRIFELTADEVTWEKIVGATRSIGLNIFNYVHELPNEDTKRALLVKKDLETIAAYRLMPVSEDESAEKWQEIQAWGDE